MSSNEKCVWLNGRLKPAAEAHVSPWDRGFILGDGVFETMRAVRGHVFAPTRHWRRLFSSCELLGIRPPDRSVFSEAVAETLAANQLQEARVRFTISRGGTADGEGEPTMTVTATALTNAYDVPATVTFAAWPRNEHSPMVSIKSVSYAEQALALERARQAGADECLFANTRGNLCEGATSNVFFVENDAEDLVTPSLESGCLPGVTRSLILDLARKNGIPVHERAVPASALAAACEAFLTSSIRQVQPISKVEDRPLPSAPGPLTARLSVLLEQLMAEEPDP